MFANPRDSYSSLKSCVFFSQTDLEGHAKSPAANPSEEDVTDDEEGPFGIKDPVKHKGPIFGAKFATSFSSTASVTFSSLVTKEMLVRSLVSNDEPDMIATSAPAPSDILWENVSQNRITQRHKRWLANSLWSLGILFWAVPVALVQVTTRLPHLWPHGMWV